METVKEFTNPGDRVGVGGECDAAVTARTRCGQERLGSVVRCCMDEVYSKAKRGCLRELCTTSHSLWR